MRTAVARPTIGDRATSDVVVRLRTPEGRDEWLYCHSAVLAAGSEYFADRLSDAWPTCQILDSRYCVEVRCADPDLSSHVTALRLLYPSAGHDPVSRFGVRGALALLRAAACADYLESAPWDEADEEEILAAVPCLAGAQYDRVLARLRPADPTPATAIFLSAFRHATAPPAAASRELKSAAQEQLEYMLTEDADAPLLAFDADGSSGDAVRSQVKDCVAGLLSRLSDFTSSALTKQMDMEAPCSGDGELQQELHSFVSDISWVCQVLGKLEMMKCLAAYWVGASSDVVAAVEAACPGSECLKTRLKVAEIYPQRSWRQSRSATSSSRRRNGAMLLMFGSDSQGQQSIWSIKPTVATTKKLIMATTAKVIMVTKVIMVMLKQQQRLAWTARSGRGWSQRLPQS